MLESGQVVDEVPVSHPCPDAELPVELVLRGAALLKHLQGVEGLGGRLALGQLHLAEPTTKSRQQKTKSKN